MWSQHRATDCMPVHRLCWCVLSPQQQQQQEEEEQQYDHVQREKKKAVPNVNDPNYSHFASVSLTTHSHSFYMYFDMLLELCGGISNFAMFVCMYNVQVHGKMYYYVHVYCVMTNTCMGKGAGCGHTMLEQKHTSHDLIWNMFPTLFPILCVHHFPFPL